MTHYDLTAMSFHAGSTRSVLAFDGPGLAMAFDWSATPQGHDFWSARSDDGLDEPARAALREMLGQWEGEQRAPRLQIIDLPTARPASEAYGYQEDARGNCLLTFPDGETRLATPDEVADVQAGIDRLRRASSGPVAPGMHMLGCRDEPEVVLPAGGAVATADRTITLKIGRHVRVVSAPSDDWIAHDGGPCPVAPETVVEVRFHRASMFALAGSLSPVAARDLDWSRDEGVIPITHYRIVSPAPETPTHQAMNAGAKQRERDIGDKLQGYEAEIARHHAMIERIAAEKTTRTLVRWCDRLKMMCVNEGCAPSCAFVRREASSTHCPPETSADIARSHGLAFGRGGKWGEI